MPRSADLFSDHEVYVDGPVVHLRNTANQEVTLCGDAYNEPAHLMKCDTGLPVNCATCCEIIESCLGVPYLAQYTRQVKS